ncbi:MAG: Do family serine endopeptidase [Verrucomicrobiota bacterium]
MRSSVFYSVAFATTAVAALFAGFTASQLFAKADEPRSVVELQRDHTPLDRSNTARIVSYADVLDKVTPAVASVHTEHVGTAPEGQRDWENMLRRYYGMPEIPEGEEVDPYIEQGLGSGFVVTEDGYVLTNNHVVSGRSGSSADKIIVKLSDGREFDAALVGKDPQSDVAVLKIDTEGEALPFLPMGDSKQLRVGDIVFAVGNPLSVGLTVTQGIVSALERTDLGIISRRGMPAMENFIQTDAAINRGNSGGPLVDAEGRVIGINTAIVSQSGGSIGIGFAIPVNLAARVMQSLVEQGEVRRGFIGVQLEPLDRELAQAFGLDSSRGALISRVTPNLPGDKAGLRHGDVVTKVNGQAVDSVPEMIYLISSEQPGSTVDLSVFRNGEEQSIAVVLGDRTKLLEGEPVVEAEPVEPEPPKTSEFVEGIEVAPLSEVLTAELELPEDLSGLQVVEVSSGSPYSEILVPGMVIQLINGQKVTSAEEARKALRVDGANALYVYYNENYQYLPLIVKG